MLNFPLFSSMRFWITPVLIGLVARNDQKLVDVYYNKAKQYMISTKEDDMYSDLLDKIYEEYKK